MDLSVCIVLLLLMEIPSYYYENKYLLLILFNIIIAIRLGGNRFGDKGVQFIAEALEFNSFLKSIEYV